ncbi:flagellar hook-basal body protein [Alicyclobacillus ferrooxydans]|uniref:Uncharacterized protein n=1 Tax=Alicyclobacillus ferrooxydans TaxID=471514 RepID=A0A0P9CFQ6_9BACL|nr:flagellar hook-basal body complex protein [Alicyclobacillus ferrooxydans]KPV44404.1 hypothetical protein AN477_07185 [Alicyclobacillus ferrooxydans]
MGLLDTPVSGMDAYNQWMQVIGNNIANVNTVGYKSSDVNFETMLSQTMSQGASAGGGTNPEQVGLGVAVGQIAPNFSEGSLVQTGSPSDMAINGNGFFVVNTKPDGTGTFYYERAGNFAPDSNGYLVDPNGNYLMGVDTSTSTSGTGSGTGTGSANTTPTWSAINIESLAANSGTGTTGTTPTFSGQPSTYTIGQNGTITVQNGKTYNIMLADFPNPSGLDAVGNNLYQAPTGGNEGTVTYNQGGQSNLGTIQQGMLEQSNVDLTKEMSNMIQAQTDYNANSKVINTANGMLQFMLQQV